MALTWGLEPSLKGPPCPGTAILGPSDRAERTRTGCSSQPEPQVGSLWMEPVKDATKLWRWEVKGSSQAGLPVQAETLPPAGRRSQREHGQL